MLVSGLLPQYPERASYIRPFNHDFVLITYIQNNIILFKLGEELRKIKSHKTLKLEDNETSISVFQHNITKLSKYKIKPEYLLKNRIIKFNIHENEKVVYPYVWSDWSTHYLGYYENYNYNKMNILKRNSGLVFAIENSTHQYEPWYPNKESNYTINLKHKFEFHISLLNHKLQEYMGNLDSADAIEKELYERKISTVVFQLIEKVILHKYKQPNSSFLSSNTAIKSRIIIVSSNKSKMYHTYQSDSEMGLIISVLILYLIRYQSHHDIKVIEKWILEFIEYIMEDIKNLNVYSNLQIFTNLYIDTDNQSRYVNKIICLRYIEIGFDKYDFNYRFGIIAPQSIINESKTDKMSNTKKLADEILRMLKERNYSQLGISDHVNYDTKLNYRCVFIY